ncbi:MAG: hypothetical protein ACOCXA_06495 [Planctomycetota bacterium]
MDVLQGEVRIIGMVAFRLLPSGFRLSAFRFPLSGFRLPPSACRLPPAAFRLPLSALCPVPCAGLPAGRAMAAMQDEVRMTSDGSQPLSP